MLLLNLTETLLIKEVLIWLVKVKEKAARKAKAVRNASNERR